MTALTSHLSAAELESRYETAADPVSKSHFHAIWLLSSGHTNTEVAAILSFSARWVRLLRKRYNEQGPDSLGDRRQRNGSTPAGHHRYEWLYVSFVEPATGATVWNVSNAVCKELFEAILLDFAKSAGAGANKRIVLQLDGAGWHGPENLAVPDGVRLVFQPSHSPELQPAEHLWEFVDEPLVNTYFETIQDLEKLVGERCVALTSQREMIRASTLFHWWPKPCEGN